MTNACISSRRRDTSHPAHSCPPPSRPRERGVVLVISLIVLVALTLAGIALVRSTDTGNVISGNLAFRMAALQAVDTGVEAAFTAVTGPGGFAQSADVANSSNPAGLYFPTINDANGDGMPDVTWSAIVGTDVQGNTVRWVVERLCAQNVGVAQADQIATNCAVVPGPPNMSFKAGAVGPNNPVQSVAYRITVQVEGPRNTVVFSQSVIAM
jgi:Tfp pilus assembly protein PilX